MNLIEKLDMLKARTGDNTLSLAKKAGIPPTTLYGLYTKGYEKMQLSTLQALCDSFGVTLDYLAKDDSSPSDPYTQEAIRVASDYDALDPHGQRAVRAIMDVELSRVNDPPAASPASVVRLRRYLEPAAAGSPLWSESGFEYVNFPASVVPSGADFAVGISGHSMEPDLPDGCTVFVRQSQSVGDGDIIVAWIEGEGTICKRVSAHRGKISRLYSVNPDYPAFSGPQLENLRIYGKVVGYTI